MTDDHDMREREAHSDEAYDDVFAQAMPFLSERSGCRRVAPRARRRRSKSHTPLLKLDDDTNEIERLYPIPARAYP